jgi:universal stress protein A
MELVELIQEGEPAEEIFKAIKNQHIDLLIMTAHEEGRLEHFLLGRSNDEIIRKMPCSVLLVKHHLKPLPYSGTH